MFQKDHKKFFDKKARPLKAIDTLETLKLINMLYLSSSKKKWVLNNRKGHIF